ncbi:uncharacterized protein LOC106086055 [Stomoxys calcitrans]|uniref:Protein TsetseEP domain-containing protein n=1 Tax=Stomoxys calcitrans TaxID=35570 RepID=A0A1I8NYU2_STOCA|nr:uncharacterized protein LOC106086055 [Stomoxys calcitrans]
MACIKIFAFLTLLALAKAQQNFHTAHMEHNAHRESLVRNDDYIDAHRRQYAFNIWYYDVQINEFKASYLDRVKGMEYQKDSLLIEIDRADEKLYPIKLLSDFSKSCVNKYEAIIPAKEWAKTEMDRCMSQASNKVDYLVTYMVSTNRTLQNQYSNVFEKQVASCETRFNTSSLAVNQTLCLSNAVAETNTFTQNNQKTFSTQLEEAHNDANINIKALHECSFAVQNTTLIKISEANTRIDRCVYGIDDCTQCQGHFCTDVYPISSSKIDPKNPTMANPFYGRSETGSCLMLNIY